MLAVKILMLIASSQSMADARATEYCNGLDHAFFQNFEEGKGVTIFACQKTFPKHLTTEELNGLTVIPVEAKNQNSP